MTFQSGQILVDQHGRYHSFDQYKTPANMRAIFHNLPDSHATDGMRVTNVTDPTDVAFLYLAKQPTLVTRSQCMIISNAAFMCAAIGAMSSTGVRSIIWQDFQVNDPDDLEFRARLIRSISELGLQGIKIASQITENKAVTQ